MAEQTPSFTSIDINGDMPGQLVIGNGNVVSTGPPAAPPDAASDAARLAEFAREVRRALPELDLPEERRAEIESLVEGILRPAGERPPDHQRVRALGQSLRTVLEGSTAGVLSSVLLAGWPP